MFDAIQASARAHIFPGADNGLKFLASDLGDDAGITGAAALVQARLG